MTDTSEESKMEKAWDYYEKIKQSLDGLFEILTLNFDKDEMFYQCGVDNLQILKETIMDLLKHDYNPAEIKRKMRDLEFSMKKCLFFDKDQEEEKESRARE
ncbi:MAG: hypothetical protein EU539_06345 [Promethearchaeota archaeon]|nr:MAG: hypothetical protein EU539_06345 [Candidatus Lokiarchaeota archaeon]